MELPSLRALSRRTLLLLWLPSTLFSLSLAALLLVGAIGDSHPEAIVKLSNPNGSLFAAAPPRGQVLAESVAGNADTRTQALIRYLQAHNSPLAYHAGTFVTVADRYDLDWRLLVAIAGKESSFGKYIPPGSYNAWGWGIPTGASSGIAFSSWDEGIERVGYGLRHYYLNRGHDTLEEIEPIYTPPSAARPDHPWLNGVSQFMAEISSYERALQ